MEYHVVALPMAKSMYFVLKHIMFPNLVNSEFMKSRMVIATWPHGKAMQKTSRKPCSTCWKSGWISSPGLRYTLQPGNGANPEVKANFYIGLGVHDIDDGLGFIENMALEFTTPTHSFAGYPSNSFQRIAQSKLARMFDQGGFQELHEWWGAGPSCTWLSPHLSWHSARHSWHLGERHDWSIWSTSAYVDSIPMVVPRNVLATLGPKPGWRRASLAGLLSKPSLGSEGTAGCSTTCGLHTIVLNTNMILQVNTHHLNK